MMYGGDVGRLARYVGKNRAGGAGGPFGPLAYQTFENGTSGLLARTSGGIGSSD